MNLIPNASPQLQVALNAMDQSMVGQDAYLRAVALDLAAFGPPATNAGAAGTTGSGLTLTSMTHYSYGCDENNACKTYDDILAKGEAANAERRARDLERLARQRASARACRTPSRSGRTYHSGRIGQPEMTP